MDDITFQLLANPTKLKKKEKKRVVTEEDSFFLRIKYGTLCHRVIFNLKYKING